MVQELWIADMTASLMLFVMLIGILESTFLVIAIVIYLLIKSAPPTLTHDCKNILDFGIAILLLMTLPFGIPKEILFLSFFILSPRAFLHFS